MLLYIECLEDFDMYCLVVNTWHIYYISLIKWYILISTRCLLLTLHKKEFFFLHYMQLFIVHNRISVDMYGHKKEIPFAAGSSSRAYCSIITSKFTANNVTSGTFFTFLVSFDKWQGNNKTH